jgi:hypothetical protein
MPSRRAVRRFDVAAAVVVAAFLTLGALAWSSLDDLAALDASLSDGAEALELASRGIALLGDVPVVGDPADRLAGSVAQAAQSMRANAEDVRSNVTLLAVVVGLTIAVLPLPLLLGFYLPLRLSRRREVRGLRRLLARPVEPMLVEHLARGAVARIPYAELRRISTSPWRDLEAGHHHELAAAELRRLGVAPPRDWAGGAPTAAPGRRGG